MRKYLSWNVNGLRAVLQKGFMDFFAAQKPDVLCLQEIKAEPEQVELSLPAGYRMFWNPAERKGYSGTATISRHEPISVTRGLGNGSDPEGRVQTLEFGDHFLVNVYTPNSKRDLSRLGYREKDWDPSFLKYIRGLSKKKPVVFCGDLNVAHKEIDLANPKNNRRNAGFTDEERKGFDNIVKAGFIDTFRAFEQGGGHYTWWSYMNKSRERNIGWRIDYWCVSPELAGRLKESTILPDVMGSDHCPVVLKLR